MCMVTIRNLDVSGNSEIIVRYGGHRYTITVVGKELRAGWSTFISDGDVSSGDVLFGAFSGGNVISILRYKGGVGLRNMWENNANAYDVDFELIEGHLILDGLDDVDMSFAYLTAYFPPYMSLLFTFANGVTVFEPGIGVAMKAPINLQQEMLLSSKKTVGSGDFVFEAVSIELGYFTGDGWVNLVRECELAIGFKLFFFLNYDGEFEMIVIGHGNVEVVYRWARTYYRRD